MKSHGHRRFDFVAASAVAVTRYPLSAPLPSPPLKPQKAASMQ